MKNIATIYLSLILAGCASDAQWFPDGGGIYGRSVKAVDDEKCRELGFESGTEAYGNCRLQIEQIRAIERASVPVQSRTTNSVVYGAEQGRRVYDYSECVGPVIMGRCEGSIVPNRTYHPTCHGAWLNGRCTGPII